MPPRPVSIGTTRGGRQPAAKRAAAAKPASKQAAALAAPAAAAQDEQDDEVDYEVWARTEATADWSGPEGIPMDGDDGEDDEDDEDFEPAIEEEEEFDDADMEMDDDGDSLQALAAEAAEAAATETAKEAAAEEATALEEARSLPIADFKDLDALMCAALRLLRACTGAGGMAAPSTHGCSQARRHTCQDKQSLHLRSLWRCRCAICVHCVQGALLRPQEVPVCDQAHPRRFGQPCGGCN